MLYDITLRIRYDYASPAATGRHLVRLLPRDLGPLQRVTGAHLSILPQPDDRAESADFFRNAMTAFAYRHPHDKIELCLRARVDRTVLPTGADTSALLADLPAQIAAHRSLGAASPLHFTAPSIRAEADAAMADFARKHLSSGMRVSDAVVAVGTALHHYMTFDPEATRVDTRAAEAFAARRGVCQDYSHILIACLRASGIPAGYVSGFLRTHAPPGKPRLEGADAMHAWVRAWCGADAGWQDFDPTNAVRAGEDHITVARGRDYFDVAPVKGVLRATGGQISRQEVDVVPEG